MIDQQSAELERTIFPVATVAGENRALASEVIHRSLRQRLPDDSLHGISKSFSHVGQPVPIGNGSVLRVCLSMPHVIDAAENMARGQAFEVATAPLMADIDGLFLNGRASRKTFAVARSQSRIEGPLQEALTSTPA
jgi:hypothetical protein